MGSVQDPLPVPPLTRPVDATVQVPGSKSYTNRALLIAALAEGRSTLRGALFSEDTERMADSLRRLGFRVEEDAADHRFDVWGEGGRIPAAEAELFVGNSGTTARSIVALLALGHGRYLVDGVPRMRQRPIQPLLTALQALGVRASSIEGTGCPPVLVETEGLQGGEISMPGDQSSQYFSALLMVAPVTPRGLTIHVEGEMVSKPYIDLTADIMNRFGARMERDAEYRLLQVPGGQRYRGRDYRIEPDASNASYFFAAAAITGGRVRVEGLGRGSAQGDLRLLEALEAMGCAVERGEEFIELRGPERLRALSVDANAYSDMAQTLFAIAPFADGPTEVRNVAHSRLQECDRIAASAAELRRLGQDVEEFPDGLRITPRPIAPAVVQTYDDHRMAMAFALVGLKAPGIAIADPGCTRKTFPDYWERLERLRA
ncbi:MAG TPA: 3-phosphoshikimate 1-carboxyvinyltransferase [Armatimonadota bacterium]|nr:3-phosphoshikimate 1-carboxyvinyltransferase [Armatimonadota bacterium]